jgi:hypothetical protein
MAATSRGRIPRPSGDRDVYLAETTDLRRARVIATKREEPVFLNNRQV